MQAWKSLDKILLKTPEMAVKLAMLNPA